MKLDGTRVLVTGATGGVGPSIVEALLAVGARVIASARRRTGLDALRAELRQHERLDVAECDASDPEGVERLFEALERKGGLGGVVHAVGAFRYGLLAGASDDDVRGVIDANVLSTAWVVRGAARRMTGRGAGSIVVIAADRALEPAPGVAVYGAAKAASAHLVQAAALELHGSGVRVNAILPGVIDTPDNRAAMPDADPAGWASPRAIARACVWLLGPDAAGVSGALVRVPGK